jgi:hypothetical protein
MFLFSLMKKEPKKSRKKETIHALFANCSASRHAASQQHHSPEQWIWAAFANSPQHTPAFLSWLTRILMAIYYVK